MVKLIIGLKGTGKTKTLIGMVNSAIDSSDGAVVCLEKGDKLRYDIRYQARLIDVAEYGVDDGQALYGFMLPTAILRIYLSILQSKCARKISMPFPCLSERLRHLPRSGISISS